MKEQNNLPAMNDEELRQRQFIRYTEGLGDLGDYAKELKKSTKISMWIGITWSLLIFLFFSFVIIYQYSNGGISSIIDTEGVTRRFNCSNGVYEDVLRTYNDVDLFLKNYGGECKIYKVTEGKK